MLGLVYIGRTIHFANTNRPSRLMVAHVPGGHYAQLMYSGAIVVIVFVGFAVFTMLLLMRSMKDQFVFILRLKEKPPPLSEHLCITHC
jgi:hypothetical protein